MSDIMPTHFRFVLDGNAPDSYSGFCPIVNVNHINFKVKQHVLHL